MGIDITTCRACKLSTIRFTGAVDGATVLEAFGRLKASDMQTSEFDQLWDYREVTRFVVTQNQLKRMTVQLDDWSMQLGEGRTAILVLNVIHEAYANLVIRVSKDPGRMQRTFRRQEQAIGWLQETNGSLQRSGEATCACATAFA